jgi:hypothetical protein
MVKFKEEFETFMQFNGYWENFLKNAGEQYLQNFDRRVELAAASKFAVYTHILHDSFDFGTTDEGRPYWENVDDDWQDYIAYWKHDLTAEGDK